MKTIALLSRDLEDYVRRMQWTYPIFDERNQLVSSMHVCGMYTLHKDDDAMNMYRIEYCQSSTLFVIPLTRLTSTPIVIDKYYTTDELNHVVTSHIRRTEPFMERLSCQHITQILHLEPISECFWQQIEITYHGKDCSSMVCKNFDKKEIKIFTNDCSLSDYNHDQEFTIVATPPSLLKSFDMNGLYQFSKLLSISSNITIHMQWVTVVLPSQNPVSGIPFITVVSDTPKRNTTKAKERVHRFYYDISQQQLVSCYAGKPVKTSNVLLRDLTKQKFWDIHKQTRARPREACETYSFVLEVLDDNQTDVRMTFTMAYHVGMSLSIVCPTCKDDKPFIEIGETTARYDYQFNLPGCDAVQIPYKLLIPQASCHKCSTTTDIVTTKKIDRLHLQIGSMYKHEYYCPSCETLQLFIDETMIQKNILYDWWIVICRHCRKTGPLTRELLFIEPLS